MEIRTSPSSNHMMTEETSSCQSLESGMKAMPSDPLSANHIKGMARHLQRTRPSRSEGSGPSSQNILFRILSGKHEDTPRGGVSISENHASVYMSSADGVAQAAIDSTHQSDISLYYEADDLVDLSGRVGFGSVPSSEFLTPNDYRQRSQSMGSNFGFGVYGGVGSTMPSDLSRTSSHDSLASFDSQSDSSQPTNGGGMRLPHSHSDVQLEATRSRLKHLLMGGGAEMDPQSSVPVGEGGSLSHPGTPPSSTPNYSIMSRKYSEGSSRSHLKAKMMNFRGGAGGLEKVWARGESSELQRYLSQPQQQVAPPRRRKPYSRPTTEHLHRTQMDTLCDDAQAEHLMLADEGYDDGSSPLLKMMLTRGRSNSVSVFESYRLTGSALPRCHTMGGSSRRQHVQLAKKNLLPIAARVSDRLNKVIEFATSLPEFMRMSVADQMTLLVGACPRLLLLYMAEMNLQFAVTPVHDDGASGIASSLSQTTVAMPTVQFVDAVQTFIKKCQTMNVTANEYFYMRMIALFRTGPGGTLESSEAAERIHSEARQDLQEVVQHSHPDEKLRYISLLLSLHTLFSVNCAMLQVLFCDPIISSTSSSSSSVTAGCGGLEGFIRKRLEERRVSATAGIDQEKSAEFRTSPKPADPGVGFSSSSSSSSSVTPTEGRPRVPNGFFVPTITTGCLTNGFVEPTAVTAVERTNGFMAPAAVTTVGLGFLAPTTTGSWSMVGTS